MSGSRARAIYDGAMRKAHRDHMRMFREFMNGEIEIASPSQMDREREYIIKAFDKALGITEPLPGDKKTLQKSRKSC